MSFERSLDKIPLGVGIGPPKHRREDDGSFEKRIKASIEKMQGCRRRALSSMDRGSRGLMSRRIEETLDQSIAEHSTLAKEMEQAFRDWTIHLAGEPSERHRKKFSYEKLQRAYDEECREMRAVAKRVQDLLSAAVPPGTAVECQSMCENEERASLLESSGDMSDADIPSESETEDDFLPRKDPIHQIQTNIVLERDEGIKRIQNQVNEVNQIFRDLGQMVEEQGTHLETIESAAEATSHSISSAVVETKQMGKRQQARGSCLCCVFTVAFLILAIISGLIVFAWYSSSSNGSVPDGAQRIETDVGDLGRWGFGEAPSPLHRVSDKLVSASS
jgi:t-SNARE complex subunit (syntaxin)